MVSAKMVADKTPAQPGSQAPTGRPNDARSQALATISVAQAANMEMRRELISVRVRVATTRENHETLRARAIQLEAQKIVVPDPLKSLIARASEDHDVAFAIYQSRLHTASTEKSAAATARDALREWHAGITVNILHGKNVPELHDLLGGPVEYDPPPPREIERTVENAAWKDSYCAVRASLDKQIASWARLHDQALQLTLRAEPIPLAHGEALQKAASTLYEAEIHMCNLLLSSNTNVTNGLAEGNIPTTVKALRTVNWLQGLPPPSKADFPPGWKPNAVPSSSPARNYSNLYDLLPMDDTEYEEVGSDSLTPEDNDRAEDSRAGKKRRGQNESGSQAVADPSYVDGIVLTQVAEAKQMTAEIQESVIRAMEDSADTGNEQDDAAAQAAAKALARAAITPQHDTDSPMQTRTMDAGPVDTSASFDEAPTDTKKKPTGPGGTSATHDQIVLSKAQRIARDSNMAFFKAVDSRLNGEADAIPCHKCDTDICYLAIKSRGDLHPTYQAQLCGNKCGKTSAPSVCLQAWLANGTLNSMLNATSPAMDTTSPPSAEQAAQNDDHAEKLQNTIEENRANDLDSALLKMEREAQMIAEGNARREKQMQARAAAYQKDREERDAAFQRERDEHAMAVANAKDILQTITGNLAKIREAQANRTAVLLDPTPAQYIPECPPPMPPVLSATVPYAQAASLQHTSSGLGANYTTAYPPISRQGPQIPRAPFQRAEVRQTYARALQVPPRQSITQQRQRRRDIQCMNAVKFILITNFDHCPIRQTKEEFAKYLEDGTDILHYRRMPFQGLEVAVLEYQLVSISQQFRQMGFVLATNYSPTNPMARRRAGESVAQNADRQAHVAHRAFSRVCDQPRTQIAVKNWFARERAIIETRYPHVFTSEGQKTWNETYHKEAQTRREAEEPAESGKDSTPAGENLGSPTTTTPKSATPASSDKSSGPGTPANARDNAV